tara:strand:- start:1568 stop:2569 length:1002 start_codon:yes stop_codon:yes gene_type:complete
MSRRVYQDGTAELIGRIINGENVLIDPDGQTVTVDIYPPGSDPRNAGTVPGDALSLANATTRTGVGVYRYDYSVAVDAEDGTYYDRWHWTVDGVALDHTFEFEVVPRTNLESYEVQYNHTIRVVLDSTITSDDTAETLGSDYEMYFFYEMNPFYSTLRLLEMEGGAYIQDITDDTLEAEILLASLEADTLTFISENDNDEYFQHVRRRFVTCKALLRVLSNVYATFMKRKRLADLDVSYGNGLPDKLDQMANCVSEMELALNSGGNITPHTSLRPSYTIPGISNLDRPVFGRGWQRTNQNIANTRDYPTDYHKRVRKAYTRTPRGGKNWTNTS